MNIDNFTCSRGQIDQWKDRHNIKFGKIVGKAKSVNTSEVTDWLKKVWQTLKANYCDDDIFNLDETGLFFHSRPDKTFRFHFEKCRGGKLSKERVAVLVGANLSGKKKIKLMVIGKAKNPRCFKNVKTLPVTYENNKKGWMTFAM